MMLAELLSTVCATGVGVLVAATGVAVNKYRVKKHVEVIVVLANRDEEKRRGLEGISPARKKT